MAKFRKKPGIIEAFRYGEDPAPQWFELAWATNKVQCFSQSSVSMWCEIDTLEGTMRGKRGDWIIRGVQGEIYPCKDAIFRATYDLVEEDPADGGKEV